MSGTATTAGSSHTVIAASDLRTFAARILERAGMPSTDAQTMADVLLWADLRAIEMQGVLRLPMAIRRMDAGVTKAATEPTLDRDGSSFAVMNGAHMWGPVAAVRAMQLAMAKAQATGIGGVAVRDTTFAFALGYYPALASAGGMIGLAINNSLPLIAPPGGTTKVIGNQAFALGCPARRHKPILLDTAMSAITWTAIHELQERGKQLPEGVAVGPDGRPTTDPVAAIAGRLLPLGGAKGFGLALMFEILTGVLSGGDRFTKKVTVPNDLERPMAVSLFMLAIDPRFAMDYDLFLERVDQVLDEVVASETEPGVERVYVAGERSAETAARRERDGIPLAEATATELRALGARLGVPWPGPG